jgi:3-hydroxyacyl-CoA dehydrogenase|tara:strand:- start:255 stop:404 length:150 start_codon:yes stop_codon:yes gene_type:complete
MKATQLTSKQVDKIIYALELTYGNIDNYDKVGMDLAKKISNAKAVITAK